MQVAPGRAGAARAARPPLHGRPARAVGRRGACPGRRTPLCRRRPRPLGGQRPHSRPRRHPHPGLARPRARHQLGRHLPGRSSPCASRSAGRWTSAPAAASRHCTSRAHAERVTATDVNQRALWLTRFNAELNGLAAQDRGPRGQLLRTRRRRGFDLVATNPPFVISPATGERLVYRDSGLPGDRVVEHIVRGVPRTCWRDGGTAQVLANWTIHRDQPWDERLAAWITGCDAWVVQREVVDLPTYVELWLKDAGVHPSTGGAVGRGRTTSATTPGSRGSRSRVRRPWASGGST